MCGRIFHTCQCPSRVAQCYLFTESDLANKKMLAQCTNIFPNDPRGVYRNKNFPSDQSPTHIGHVTQVVIECLPVRVT